MEKETFERVSERRGKIEVPIKHFYRRQYPTGGSIAKKQIDANNNRDN